MAGVDLWPSKSYLTWVEAPIYEAAETWPHHAPWGECKLACTAGIWASDMYGFTIAGLDARSLLSQTLCSGSITGLLQKKGLIRKTVGVYQCASGGRNER